MTDQERIESLFRESFLKPSLACLEVHSPGVYQLQASAPSLRTRNNNLSRCGRTENCGRRLKDKTAGPFQEPAIRVSDLAVLCLNDARRNEEDKFLVRGADRAAFEQVAQVRYLPEERDLLHVQ